MLKHLEKSLNQLATANLAKEVGSLGFQQSPLTQFHLDSHYEECC